MWHRLIRLFTIWGDKQKWKFSLSSFIFKLCFSLCQCPYTHIYFLKLFNFRIIQVFHRLHTLASITHSPRNCVKRCVWGWEKGAPRAHGTTEGIHSKVRIKWHAALPAFIWHLHPNLWVQRFNLTYKHFPAFWLRSSVISLFPANI